MCAPHPIDPANLLAPIPTAVPPEYETQSRGGTEGAPEATTEHTQDTDPAAPDYYVTPDGVVVAPESAAGTAAPPEAPMTRIEAIQILSRGLVLADRRTRSAHLMGIHALAKRGSEHERYLRRKAALRDRETVRPSDRETVKEAARA